MAATIRPNRVLRGLLLLLSLTASAALKLRLPSFGRRQGRSPPSVPLVDAPPLLSSVEPPPPLDAATEKRRRADVARLAAETALDEAARFAAEAKALKAQLQELTPVIDRAEDADLAADAAADAAADDVASGSVGGSVESVMDSSAGSVADSSGSIDRDFGSSMSSAATSPVVVPSVEEEDVRAAVDAMTLAAASFNASLSACLDAAADDEADEAERLRLEKMIIEAVDAAEASSDAAAERMMEEAASRVVWAELGLGPQEAFPLEPLDADAIARLKESVFGLDVFTDQVFSVRQVQTTPCEPSPSPCS